MVWIDYKREAFTTSKMEDYEGILLKGFHDDDMADTYVEPKEWAGWVNDAMTSQDLRVDVVIVNRRHESVVLEIIQNAERYLKPPPKIIVITRPGVQLNLATWGAPTGHVVSRWEEATQIAIDEVKRRRGVR